MPNWCFSTLDVAGPASEIKRFMNELRTKGYNDMDDQHNICRSLIPQPKNLSQEGQTDWQYDNWGSKWGDCNTEILSQEKNLVQFKFESAWGPLLEGFLRISRMFNLAFVYSFSEEGNDFFGCYAIIRGKHREFQYSTDEIVRRGWMTFDEMDENPEDRSQYVDELVYEAIDLARSSFSENLQNLFRGIEEKQAEELAGGHITDAEPAEFYMHFENEELEDFIPEEPEEEPEQPEPEEPKQPEQQESEKPKNS